MSFWFSGRSSVNVIRTCLFIFVFIRFYLFFRWPLGIIPNDVQSNNDVVVTWTGRCLYYFNEEGGCVAFSKKHNCKLRTIEKRWHVWHGTNTAQQATVCQNGMQLMKIWCGKKYDCKKFEKWLQSVLNKADSKARESDMVALCGFRANFISCTRSQRKVVISNTTTTSELCTDAFDQIAPHEVTIPHKPDIRTECVCFGIC